MVVQVNDWKMVASELRIGNWVSWDEEKLTPIPLTEEILLKCGFEKDRFGNYSLGLFELLYNDIIGFRFSMEGQWCYEEIKYLHQLQNLFYSLCGKELEIKL